MEQAGLPPDKAYSMLELGPGARERVATFRRLFARGVDPATAGSNSGLFTLFETRLLRAALSGGSPLPTYRRLTKHYATAAAQQASMRSRLMLPAATLVVALLVQPIPLLYSGAISFGGYLARSILPLIVLGVVSAIAIRAIARYASGEPGPVRDAVSGALLRIPFIGRLHLRRSTRDFLESLALLLQAGLPLFEALPVAIATVDNAIVREDLSSLLPAVQSGATLSEALAALRLCDTGKLHAFAHTGEESGSLPEMLQRYSDMETEALAQIQSDISTWLPRLFYVLVALWMVVQLIGGRAVPPPASMVASTSTSSSSLNFTALESNV
ncbi:type II secretion system F family protein [Massilia glaciei]|nr:type II secretion system F family protein [Massilia glaciei]